MNFKTDMHPVKIKCIITVCKEKNIPNMNQLQQKNSGHFSKEKSREKITGLHL